MNDLISFGASEAHITDRSGIYRRVLSDTVVIGLKVVVYAGCGPGSIITHHEQQAS